MEVVEVTLLKKHGDHRKGAKLTVDELRAKKLIGTKIARYSDSDDDHPETDNTPDEEENS